MKKILLVLLSISSSISCSSDDKNDLISQVLVPDNYSFQRAGSNTVSFLGQTTRLNMAVELKGALGDPSKTETELNAMYLSGTGFSSDELNNSGKNLSGKTASYGGSTTAKQYFTDWISEVTGVVFPAWNSDASEGIPGLYTDEGGSGRSVRINGKGLEIDQAFTKGLIGALAADQIINGYLSSAKLDGGTNIEDNNNDVLVEDKPYTTMEHFWDEGFGYLYGKEVDVTSPTLETGDVLLNYYLNSLNKNESYTGIAKVIYDAFVYGRAAIVAKNYSVRDAQAKIIKVNLSKVIGDKAAHYLRAGVSSFEAGNKADAFHFLSEAYGFILSLQFTQKEDGNPCLSNSEVTEKLETLMAGNGFWDRTNVELIAMADEIDAATGLVTK